MVRYWQAFWAWAHFNWKEFIRFGNHTWTIMWIPHSERQSRSIHVSNFLLIGVLSSIMVGTSFGVLYFIDFTVKFKELLRLQRFKDIHQVNSVAFEKELQFYLNQAKPFKKEIASLSEKVPTEGLRLPNLSEFKSSGISKDEKNLSNAVLARLSENAAFLKDSSELMKQLDKFVSKRGPFFSLFPTLYPVEKGLGFIYKKNGDGNFLRISLLPGTRILASGEGTVISLDRDDRGRLNLRIDHGFGIFTDYRGLAKAIAYKGDKVKKGEAIGLSDSDFFYVVQIAETWVDPLLISSIKESIVTEDLSSPSQTQP